MSAPMQQMVALLEEFVEVLEPFTHDERLGSRSWNGTEYAPVTTATSPDPYALAWRTALGTAANLLQSQHGLSPDQFAYLRDSWFGGMGSLNDFSLDATHYGERATAANERLGSVLIWFLRRSDDTFGSVDRREGDAA